MNSSILIAIISGSASLIVAAFTFFFTKRYQTNSDWKKEKLEHYRKLLSSLSDLAIDGKDKEKANQDYSENCNTICLAASQEVIQKLMTLNAFIKSPKNEGNYDYDKEADLINKLMISIRKDIGLTKKDDLDTFQFHLIGKKGSSQ